MCGSLTVPSDFCRLFLVGAVNNPSVVFGEGQVNIIEPQNLATGNNGQCHSKTVQLVTCQTDYLFRKLAIALFNLPVR